MDDARIHASMHASIRTHAALAPASATMLNLRIANVFLLPRTSMRACSHVCTSPSKWRERDAGREALVAVERLAVLRPCARAHVRMHVDVREPCGNPSPRHRDRTAGEDPAKLQLMTLKYTDGKESWVPVKAVSWALS
jgi:hypothetical protein